MASFLCGAVSFWLRQGFYETKKQCTSALLSHPIFPLNGRAFANQGGLLSGSGILMKNPLCHCLIDLLDCNTNGIVLIVRILFDGDVGLLNGRL